jgi:Rho GDP-dissociation inhibitor
MADQEHHEGDDKGDVPEYKVGKKVGLDQLLQQDQDDESLRKYKESLLGKIDETAAPKDDPRRVVIKEMRVLFEDRPGGDIVYSLDNKEDLDKMKKNPFVLKESCHYKIRVTFKVQHEIVSGLKYVNSVFRKGLRVMKDNQMLGSFGPQAKPHEVTFPRHGWEEAPSGMLSRGSYTAKSQFVDDDNINHLEYEYAFDIKSDWK